MNLLEQVLTVWRALLGNKTRSFLTLLGVIMGVGTMVVLSSLVGGGLAAIGRTVETASGDDVLTVSVDHGNPGDARAPAPLTRGDMHAIASLGGLRGATVLPQLAQRSDARAAGRTMRVQVVGTNEAATSFYGLEVAEGRFLSGLDRSETRKVAVIGQDVARTLFANHDPFGEVRLGNTRFAVVGVLAKKPSLNVGNQTWNNAIAIPDTTYQAWQGTPNVDQILVKTNGQGPLRHQLAEANQAIQAVLEARHHPRSGLHVDDSRGDTEKRSLLGALQLLMNAVAILCLAVGGINIMNIMLVTVTERTREIGLRLAIGARKRDIQAQFLFEAAAIAGLGGLLGVLGGVALAWLLSLGLAAYLGYWPFGVDAGAIVIALAASLGTGLLFGWYPAMHAASLQPIECLRYE